MPAPSLRFCAAWFAVALVAGCSGATDNEVEGADAALEETTARSLVAAVEHHLDRRAKIAAPLFPSDLAYESPESIDDRTLAVEVALDEEVGDNSHVRLVVSPDTEIFSQYSCDSEEAGASDGCEEQSTADGADQRLVWEAFSPEEDPGYIAAAVRRDDRTVTVLYYGDEIPEDLLDSDLAGLADALLALIGDPAIGFTTTAAYAEAGAAIDDDVMLDWFGQGNGAAPPPEYERD